MQLELLIHKLKHEAQRCEEIKDEKVDEIKKLKFKYAFIKEEIKFLYQSARDEKFKSMTLQKQVNELQDEIKTLK